VYSVETQATAMLSLAKNSSICCKMHQKFFIFMKCSNWGLSVLMTNSWKKFTAGYFFYLFHQKVQM